VAASCVLSMHRAQRRAARLDARFNGTVYTWLVSGGLKMQVGFLIDRLTALMMWSSPSCR
jgi:NADH-quinone oxidoreductase subunit L